MLKSYQFSRKLILKSRRIEISILKSEPYSRIARINFLYFFLQSPLQFQNLFAIFDYLERDKSNKLNTKITTLWHTTLQKTL